MKVTPELIPHSKFQTGIWLQSIDRPFWYYYKKGKNDNTISNKNFMESVDAPLKELVKFIHKKGIKTTPSCSGHHISERNLEGIFKHLKEDKKIIKEEGLNMKNVETGEYYFFKDKNYELPWKKKKFLDKVEVYQQKGVLGICVGNRKRIKEKLLKLKMENVKIREKDNTVFIFTKEHQTNAIKEKWKQITKEVKKIMK